MKKKNIREKSEREQNSVRAHYDATIAISRDQYDTKALSDPTREYPANYFRLELLLESFKREKIKRVFEVGVGEGTPLVALAKAGMEVYGCDIAEKMVDTSRKNMKSAGLDPGRVFWGDIQDRASYVKETKRIPLVDGLVAMGVMPHVADDVRVLKNMAGLVKRGGTVFIEFRNVLFSLFTQNRYTSEFILDELLKGVDEEMKHIVAEDLKKRLRLDQPSMRTSVEGSNAPGYDAILSKFHNPLDIEPLFKRAGFSDVKLLWYHYHPAMPYLSEKNPELFRREAVKLEHEKSCWRGYFLCSAFVVEATRK